MPPRPGPTSPDNQPPAWSPHRAQPQSPCFPDHVNDAKWQLSADYHVDEVN